MCDGLKTRCTTEFYTMASVLGWRANPWNGLYFKRTIPKTVPGKFKGCSHLFTLGDQSNSFSFSQPGEFVESDTLKTLKSIICVLVHFPPRHPINGAQYLSLKSERNITLWLQKLTPGASLRHLVQFLTFQFARSLSSFRKKLPFFILPISSYWAPTDFWALCWLLKI